MRSKTISHRDTVMKVAHIFLLLVMVNFQKVEGFLLFHCRPKVDLETTEPNIKSSTAIPAMTTTTTTTTLGKYFLIQ